MAEQFATIGAGFYRFALEAGQLIKEYPEREDMSSVLADWQEFRKEQGDAAGQIPLLSLAEVFFGRDDWPEGRRRLLILSDGKRFIGLTVEMVQRPVAAAHYSRQPLPTAFPERCRRYFPQVVVCGDTAIPVLTPSILLSVAARKGGAVS